jgi:hypothetical protein
VVEHDLGLRLLDETRDGVAGRHGRHVGPETPELLPQTLAAGVAGLEAEYVMPVGWQRCHRIDQHSP